MTIKEDTRIFPRDVSFANTHAERTILGAILWDNESHAEAAKMLTAEDFSLDSHRRIFLRMTDLMESNHAVDIVTLSDRLEFFKEIDTIGGRAYLFSLTEGLPRRPVIREYIAIVKEKAKLRRIIKACAEAIHNAESEGYLASGIVKALGVDLRDIK